MIEIYKVLFFLVTGALVICIVFPRTKNTTVHGDLIEDQKVKDNSKHKDNSKRNGFLGLFKTREYRQKLKELRIKKRELRKQNKNS